MTAPEPALASTRLPRRRGPDPVLVLIAIVGFTASADNTIVAAAAGSVAADLGLGRGAVSWLSLGYVIPFAGLLLPAGALIDRFGERALLRLGGVLFGIGALLAAFAWAEAPLIAGRVVQGAAAAAVVPAALALVRTALPAGRRAAGSAAWLAALAAGLAGGPVAGGILSQFLGWRWVFLAALPCAAAIALLAGRLPARLEEPSPRSGSAIRTLLRRPGLRGGLLVQLLWGIGVSGVAFFTPIVHEQVLRSGPGVAALPLLAVALAVVAATPLVDRTATAFGVGATVAGGLVLVAAGCAALAALNGLPALPPRLPGLVVIGFGAAFTAPLTTHALGAVPERLAATAAGLLATSRELSSVVGVALAGALITGSMVAGYGRTLVLAAAITAGAAVLAVRVLPGREVRA